MAAASSPPIVLVGARLVSSRGTTLEPVALRLCDGVFTHLGEAALAAGGERRDVAGAFALPGLIDAHVHLPALGACRRELDLSAMRSEDESAARVAVAVATLRPGEWLRGFGWDHTAWPDARYPSRRSLDKASPAHPVALTRVDGHALWVNGRALAEADLSAASPEVAGGAIRRDGANAPSGVLVDNAMQAVLDRVPRPAAATLRADLVYALRRLRDVGLCGVHEMGTTPELLTALGDLARADELPLRVSCYLYGTAEELDPCLREPRRSTGLVRVVGVKLLLDGALGSHGAALERPYDDRPTERGLLLFEPQELEARVRHVVDQGFGLALHAIGDRACRLALDAIAAVKAVAPTLRHRIEHAQLIAPADVERCRALGVAVSMQPLHAILDAPFVPTRLGVGRAAAAYDWRLFAAAGVTLALGSDAPVAGEDPWRGIEAAVNGRAAHALDLGQAIDGYTGAPARAIGDEHAGALAPGQHADLTLVDRDPWAIPSVELAAVRTVVTAVAGRLDR